jgi:hypothetical protein
MYKDVYNKLNICRSNLLTQASHTDDFLQNSMLSVGSQFMESNIDGNLKIILTYFKDMEAKYYIFTAPLDVKLINL